MRVGRLWVFWMAASVSLAAIVSPALASPITYTFVQTASGTLDGVAFTNATVTTTVNADTSNARPMLPGLVNWVMNNNASVNGTVEISGLGTFELFNAIVFSTNTSFVGGDDFPNPNILYSGVGVGDLDDPPDFPPDGGFTHFQAGGLAQTSENPFYGYSLTTAMGPVESIALPPATDPPPFNTPVDYQTSGGALVITSNTGTTTFTAVGGVGNSVSLPGGPMGDPVTLGSDVAQVTGMIGDVGTSAFYRFYWPGGFFSATASVGATDPLAIYEFNLLQAQIGLLLEKTQLNQANQFTDTIAMSLARGSYWIGIDATDQPDPPFSITFATPVNGVPEPATLTLLGLGVAGLGARRWRRRPTT